jgi:hypothetical protein
MHMYMHMLVKGFQGFFFLLLSYCVSITSKLCCLKDFSILKHPNVESFRHIIVVTLMRIS